jgi:hypothetical protein
MQPPQEKCRNETHTCIFSVVATSCQCWKTPEKVFWVSRRKEKYTKTVMFCLQVSMIDSNSIAMNHYGVVSSWFSLDRSLSVQRNQFSRLRSNDLLVPNYQRMWPKLAYRYSTSSGALCGWSWMDVSDWLDVWQRVSHNYLLRTHQEPIFNLCLIMYSIKH